MIGPSQRASRVSRIATAYTIVEMLVVIAIMVGMAALLLGAIGRQGSKAEKKMRYISNRDALVAFAKSHKWNYLNLTDPRAERLIVELDFDVDLKESNLSFLCENIQPHFSHRDKMSELIVLSFNDTEFADRWMTNLIGVDQTGYPYRTDGLQRLYLENTQITDVGLKMLYVHVPELQPDSPKIQQEEVSSYAMTNLIEISVYGCIKVTRRGIADLNKALPNLKIISTFNPN